MRYVLLEGGDRDGIVKEELVCASGEEAVKMAAELKPAAILMDIVLPGITGLEATTRIRLNKRTRNVPIIGISGTVNMPEPDMQGFDDFVQKPVSMVALEDILRQHIIVASPKGR